MPKSDEAAAGDVVERRGGAGRVLIAVYVILAVAATGRSVYQLISKFDEAPVAYILSAIAGVVYIVATVALAKRRGAWRGVAWAALTFELIGVLVVGTLSLVVPQWFAHPSVWSWYGSGYLWIPLVLPVFGLTWLYRERNSAAGSSVDAAGNNEPGTR